MRTQELRRLRVGALVLAVAIACGCSGQARQVDCDGRLEPINRPAPKILESSSKPEKQAAPSKDSEP